MLEILNSGQYASPIIVFVNQKKTADMVAKDLQRAGVRAACYVRESGILLTIFGLVECRDPALRQEPRAARSRLAGPAFGRSGPPGRDRPCWPWYRRYGRYAGY